MFSNANIEYPLCDIFIERDLERAELHTASSIYNCDAVEFCSIRRIRATESSIFRRSASRTPNELCNARPLAQAAVALIIDRIAAV